MSEERLINRMRCARMIALSGLHDENCIIKDHAEAGIVQMFGLADQTCSRVARSLFSYSNSIPGCSACDGGSRQKGVDARSASI